MDRPSGGGKRPAHESRQVQDWSRRNSAPNPRWGAVAVSSHSPLSAVVVTACCTATLRRLHQRRRQPTAALARSTPGARGARTLTRRRRSSSQSRCQRPPTSLARTRRRWPWLEQFWVAGLRAAACGLESRAVRAVCLVGWAPCLVRGLTKVASQHKGSPCGVAKRLKMQNRQR